MILHYQKVDKAVISKSKIQLESKSQHRIFGKNTDVAVISKSKIQLESKSQQ